METRRIYCLVPLELSGRLHDALRRHFAERDDVEVVIERRRHDRRAAGERREGEEPPSASPADVPEAPNEDRRRIKGRSGRRVAERRAALIPLNHETAPELPRRARRYADQIAFVERLEPAGEAAEDADTARLVTRIQAGESALFTDLYLRYFDRVYAYLRLALKDRHDAEDLTQQVFTQVFEALPRYERRRQPFRGWLFIVVRNVAVSYLRGERELALEADELGRKIDRPNAASGESEPTLVRWMSDRDFSILIERLPLPQRQVLALRFLLDMSPTETAAALGRTPGGVRQIQHRALRTLEARLRPGRRDPRPDRRARMRAWPKRAPVIRSRRFALMK